VRVVTEFLLPFRCCWGTGCVSYGKKAFFPSAGEAAKPSSFRAKCPPFFSPLVITFGATTPLDGRQMKLLGLLVSGDGSSPSPFSCRLAVLVSGLFFSFFTRTKAGVHFFFQKVSMIELFLWRNGYVDSFTSFYELRK